MQKAAIPASPLAHSIATPSLVAQVMYQKFAMGLPLSRQENDWYRLGLVLSRSNMANWVIRCSQDWLEPIYWRIHEKLLECELLHMDETRIQCNKEEGKLPSSDSFMWVMRSAASEKLQAALFYYSRSRSSDNAKKLLDSYKGILITDAYAGYEKVPDIKRALCWSHARRYLVDSIPLSNNYCEANIKPFATARRAWLFADTPRGAFANGVLYTLVESARANKLDVYEYLKYLLSEMPNNHHQEDPTVIDRLLPWSEELPEQCRLKTRQKKCLKQ